MKKLITILTAVLITASVFAQAPQKMSYQSVVRNTNGTLVMSSPVGIEISILQGSPTGTLVYQETFSNDSTNANGLVSIEVGGGSVVLYGVFANIDWNAGPYFIKTGTDPTGGTNYNAIVGTSQLLSVPYALNALIADSALHVPTPTSLPPNGSAGGDLSGTYPNPSVAGLQGHPISTTAPATGDILYYNGSSWNLLNIGTKGEVLTVVNGLPAWRVSNDSILVTTLPVSNVSLTYATGGGTVATAGFSNITARGVCWVLCPGTPTLVNSHTSDGTGIGGYASFISPLTAGTCYNVRAYAINGSDTIYASNTIQFTTLTSISCPTLTTDSAIQITTSTAQSGGNITGTGGDSITARGICYSTNQPPYITDSVVSAGYGTAPFTCTMTNLTCGTLYYVRAYATNRAGTCYGPQKSFTTSGDVPIVSTDSVTSISAVGGESGGIISATCGCAITSKGIYWSTVYSTNLSAYGNKDSIGTGQSPFNASIVSASPGVTYYVQAYATNCNGTALGQVVSFTTLNNETCFGFENDMTPNGWTGAWSVETPGFQSNYSLRSAYAITSQVTDTITTGSGQVTFYYTFSNWEEGPGCEGGYATIQFYIDNVLVDTYTNDDTGNWYEGTGNISNSGNHTFKWVYNPQETCAGLTGYGYIDDVCYPH